MSNTDNFIPLFRDARLIYYQNAQILIGTKEGPDIIMEIGVEINYDKNETQESSSADIFNKLKARKDQVQIRPLIKGILE